MKRLSFLLVFAIVGCGGGGGGGSPNLAGIWLVNWIFSSQDCGGADSAENIFDVVYQVNADGQNVVMENLASGAVLTGGTIDDGTGFVVSSNFDFTCPDGTTAPATGAIVFTDVSGDSADGVLSLEGACAATTCEVTFVGRPQRS